MMSVRFVPDDRTWTGSGPVALYVAAAGTGILLEQPCGSEGRCGRCRVRVIEGAPDPTPDDRAHCTEAELAAGWRLGCTLVLRAPATVEVPAPSRSLAGKSFGPDLPAADLTRPLVSAGAIPSSVDAPAPDASSHLDAGARAAGLVGRSLIASPGALGRLAEARATAAPGPAVVVLHGRELIDVRRGTPRGLFGLAVDLGTTSLAAALVSLADGRVAAASSTLNPQSAYGADVIARIKHAMDEGDGVAHLAAAVRGGLAGLVRGLLAEAGSPASDVVLAAVAGNATMMHTWLGLSPEGLGRAPYLGLWSDAVAVKAADVGLPIHPNANVLTFPLVRSHVGGDAVAAVVATDLDRARGPRLLIDLGTNTELVLVHAGQAWATSAAAGPAFEGVSIRHGMRAAPGAIDTVSILDGGEVAWSAIDGHEPSGICGSGLIDAVAELLRAGVVTPPGGFWRAGDRRPDSRLAERVVKVAGQRAFVLANGPESRGVESRPREPIVVTARDVREVQLAKGSILAAITLLCRHAGVSFERLDAILVAGAFGNFLRKGSVLRIGLLPPVEPERVRLVGNAAGVGARLALVDREVHTRAREFAARAEFLDLAAHPGYQEAFMAALTFPSA